MLEQGFFDNIGFYGPIILIFINMYSMWKYYTYVIFYILFIFLNEGFNRYLKLIFKEPRPIGYGDNTELGRPYTGIQIYGFPSGHVQSVFFSLTYSWLVLESPYIFMLELFICFVSMYQRIKYKRHSLKQAIAGGIVGIVFGYVSYYFVKLCWIARGSMLDIDIL